MIRQHTGLASKQPKLSAAATATGHSLAATSAAPSSLHCILRTKNHKHAATPATVATRSTIALRRVTVPRSEDAAVPWARQTALIELLRDRRPHQHQPLELARLPLLH